HGAVTPRPSASTRFPSNPTPAPSLGEGYQQFPPIPFATSRSLYFLSNGTVRFDEQSRQHATPPASIRWSIQDDGRLCISEPGEPLRDGHCFTASITGDDVTISMTDRPAVSGKLLKGNARKL
ncbi:hypothetical protein, partial [Vineibacter terrae]|uniref:hypothetical protein n=1 Tax=Vineibacter terrae TaxID=2586908 RepID=UPI001C49BB62